MTGKWHTILVLSLLLLLSCDDGGRMRNDLAALESRNQSDSLLTDSTLALRLADYFDHHGTPNDRLHAHYLLARTWADLGQSPRALDEFHRAAEQADTTNIDSIGIHYLSRVYGQMGDLLYNQQLPRNALDAYEKAYHYALLGKELWAAAAFYAQKSACYYDLCLLDSAIYSNKRAFLLYQEVGDTLSANICLGALAYEYMKKGLFDNAKSYLLKFQNHSYLNEKTLQVYDSWKLLYYYWGYYYLRTEVPDSALFYFYKEEECCTNPNNRLFAYQGLYQTYEFLNKPDSTKKYALLYAEMMDSTNKQATSTTLLNIHHLYNYNRFLTIANYKTVLANQANTRALILAIAIILILFGTIVVVMRMRNRNKIIRQRLEAKYAHEILMYSNAKTRLQQMEAMGKEKWTAAMEEVERLKESLSQMQSDHQPPDQWKTAEEMLNSIIVSQFHQAASQGKMMSDSAWHQLRTMCNNMMPEFMVAIHSFNYEPNLVDTQICILIKLRFIPSEISNLLSLSPNALSKRRRRLLKNMFGMDGSSTDFDNQIHMLGE